MLSLNNITMRYGARILFEDVTCSFLEGRRYAITGPNGAGKTTLMKILEGDIDPIKGSVSRPKKLGILRQDQFAFDEFRQFGGRKLQQLVRLLQLRGHHEGLALANLEAGRKRHDLSQVA